MTFLRQALIPRSARGRQTSNPQPIPAPIGGLDAFNPIAAMPAINASIMENWQPGPADVSSRKGARYWATGFTEAVKTVAAFHDTASNSRLFAFTDGGIYNITTQGAVGSPVLNMLSGRMSYSQFGTSGGEFLVAVNGVDKYSLYRGSTGVWAHLDDTTTPAITGLDTRQLETVVPFKFRLWFTAKNSMSLWYLPVSSIAGALTEFPVGGIFQKGGYVVAAATWTIDGGSGSEDLLCIVTSRGELAVYEGTDPTSASTFRLQGVYFVGEPIGKRPFTKLGGDLLLLTETGLYPMSKALLSVTVNRTASISMKIDALFSAAADLYGKIPGWQGIVNTNDNVLVMNIATGDGTSAKQFVMNTITNAWTTYTGWNANCWEKFDNSYFFGGTNYVAQAFYGADDFGALIQCSVRQAFTYYGNRQSKKSLKLLRPIFAANGTFSYNLGVDVDFSDTDIAYPTAVITGQYPKWDTAKWNQAVWAPDYSVDRQWNKVAAFPGYAFAVRLRLAVKGVTVRWNSTDFLVGPAGVL